MNYSVKLKELNDGIYIESVYFEFMTNIPVILVSCWSKLAQIN